MRSFLKRIVVLLAVFVILTFIISFASLQFLKDSSFYKPSFLSNNFEQEQFDYIVLGASDGLTTLNTISIDSVLSTNGVNLSMDDTGPSSHYLMLEHFLSEGKKTKYCVLACNPAVIDVSGSAISNNDYRFLMYNNRKYISEYYKSFDERRAKVLYFSEWFPALGMSYYNVELFYPSIIAAVKPKVRNRFDEKGNYTYPVVNVKDKILTHSESVEINFSNEYVEKIKTLCDKNNIKLICYFAPNTTNEVKVVSENYLVINHSDAFDNTKYFYDTVHVNTIGRELISKRFAEDFKELFKL